MLLICLSRIDANVHSAELMELQYKCEPVLIHGWVLMNTFYLIIKLGSNLANDIQAKSLLLCDIGFDRQ